MKKFFEPELEVVELVIADVITTSGEWLPGEDETERD